MRDSFFTFVAMLIKQDFDQLKEILSNPESAEELISSRSPLEFKYRKVNIKSITDDEIIGKYSTGKYQYQIKFSRNKDSQIEYSIKNSNYWFLLICTIFILYKNQSSSALGIIGIIFLIIYLVNNQVKVGIYNRIHNRWRDVV